MKRSISDNDDSGARICQALGLQAHEFEGIDPADMQRYSEAEFIATGLGGNAYFFLAFERVLTGRVVFTGFAGDAAWAMEEALTAPGAIGPPAGATLSEFRLRLGFIHVPVPFIAFGQRATVRKISHSDEMAPFRVATGYDRPIPRRILQQAGVPGYLFGTEKRAASHHFFRPQFPISKISLADFRQFERQHFASIGYVLAEAWWHFRYRLFIFIRKRIGSSTAAVSVMTVLERVLARGDWVLFERSSPKRSGAMFLWALDKMRQRYRLMAD